MTFSLFSLVSFSRAGTRFWKWNFFEINFINSEILVLVHFETRKSILDRIHFINEILERTWVFAYWELFLTVIPSRLFISYGDKLLTQSLVSRKRARRFCRKDSFDKGSIDDGRRVLGNLCDPLALYISNDLYKNTIKLLYFSEKLNELLLSKQSIVALECCLELPLDIRLKLRSSFRIVLEASLTVFRISKISLNPFLFWIFSSLSLFRPARPYLAATL